MTVGHPLYYPLSRFVPPTRLVSAEAEPGVGLLVTHTFPRRAIILMMKTFLPLAGQWAR